ncbi:MAG TPA: SH3 domain-containing protein [Friedmanniella sp.]
MARIAVPLALVGLGTSGVVAFALPGSGAETAVPAPASSAPVVQPVARAQPVSRDLDRTASPTPATTSATPAPTASPTASPTTSPTTPPTKAPEPSVAELTAHAKAASTMWATDDLNIRATPDKHAKVVTEVEAGTKLAATTTVRDGFRLVVFKGAGRWVTASYVSTHEPDPATTGGVSHAVCPKGSAMEQGLTPDAVLVHRTVCADFPQVTSFGGLRGGGGFHATGQAVDCMIADPLVGRKLADWVRAHAGELGVSQVIYAQHIWTVQRGSEGWRSMPDRGSRTANHDDHVHVSVYGHRAV